MTEKGISETEYSNEQITQLEREKQGIGKK